jgi:hypothetical protein
MDAWPTATALDRPHLHIHILAIAIYRSERLLLLLLLLLVVAHTRQAGLLHSSSCTTVG